MELLKEPLETRRPRYSRAIEPLPLRLPQGSSLGPAIAAKRPPNGELFILHLGAVMPGNTTDYLPQLLRFGCHFELLDGWGGPTSFRPLKECRNGLRAPRDWRSTTKATFGSLATCHRTRPC